MMPQRNPPQRSEDQISTGHMLKPIKKQHMAYGIWRIAYSKWLIANSIWNKAESIMPQRKTTTCDDQRMSTEFKIFSVKEGGSQWNG